MTSLFSWAQIAGGLALFLMGVSATSNGFRKCIGLSTKKKIVRITDHKPMAFAFGLGLSMITQSSSVATSFAVGLVDVGMLSLAGSLVVMMGASVGGTFVTILLGLPIVSLAPGLLALTHLAVGLSQGRSRDITLALRGIATVLTGMFLIKNGVDPLVSDPRFVEILAYGGSRPWIMGIVSLLAASVLQSSSAVMALAIALAGSGSLPVQAVYPVVLGSHLGSAVIVVLAGISGKQNAALLGIGSALYKAIGVIIAIPLAAAVPSLLSILSFLSTELQCVGLQFAVVWLNALILLPCVGLLEGILRRGFQRKEQAVGEPAYLDTQLVDFPGLALSLLNRELTRLAGYLETETRLLLSAGGGGHELERLKQGTDELWFAASEYFDSIGISGKDHAARTYSRIAYDLGALHSIKEALNNGLYPLLLRQRQGKCPGKEKTPLQKKYDNVLFELVRSSMGALALGDLSMADDGALWYQKLKDLDDLIRRDIFRSGGYGEHCGLAYLARGTQLAKACMEINRGERMAFELLSRDDRNDTDAEMAEQ
ncbi:MAG: hypothetical protein CSA35_05035 [Dethiosulfovibrio peptidovorans]|nr:MAG: hypothetical protein CSA35_05035 [Dethiosulfovibrio peptidovorans]